MALTHASFQRILISLALVGVSAPAAAEGFMDNLSGNVAVEGRLFTHDPQFSGQSEQGGFSVSISPEYKYSSENGNSQFTFNPFYRWDSEDDERTHGDIRQLDYVLAKDDWELQFGIGKTFWGVTESQHLVDVINQTDGVEGLDGEDKLGQPMIRFSKLSDNGSIDFFVLPYFRERTFAGKTGRFRFPLLVDTDQARYESDSEEKHIDYALRIAESIEEYDIGFSFFDGTSRDPQLQPALKNGAPVLAPYYPLMRQYGLDLQYTGESILWKFEAIHRQPNSAASGFKAYSAAVGGFEYTLPAITESGAELSLLAEYHNDSRGEAPGVAFQNDLFLGARVGLNDENSSEMLAGAFIDLDNQTQSYRVEASRRIGEGLKLNIEAQVFTNVDKNDPFQSFAADDFIQLELQKFF